MWTVQIVTYGLLMLASSTQYGLLASVCDALSAPHIAERMDGTHTPIAAVREENHPNCAVWLPWIP